MQGYLAELYDKFEQCPQKEGRVQILTIIIDFKIENPHISNTRNTLYLDVKRFISLYLRNKRRKDYGYEDYDKEIIKDFVLNSGFNEEQKYKLLTYTRYLLSSLSYEYDWIEKIIKKTRLKLAWKKNKVKCLLIASSWNTWTLFVSILVLFAFECVLLLPAPFDWMGVCTMRPMDYSDCTIMNHVLNVISLHFDFIDNSATIEFSSWGLMVFVALYFLYIVVCVNFLFKNLFLNLEINDLD